MRNVYLDRLCHAIWSALTVLGLLLVASVGCAQTMLVGIDRKFAYEDGIRMALEPGHDEVIAFDLANPMDPMPIGALPLENSVVGPPTNLAVTPDGSLALVANSLHSVRAETGWQATPADDVSVIDLKSDPVRVLQTIRVGAQPSGVAIARSGRFALVANRVGKSLSLLLIRNQTVELLQTLPMRDAITAVAISPDERRALVVEFTSHKVAIVSIGRDLVLTDTGRELPVGLYPWNVAITPDGSRALVNNIGYNAASDGNAKTVTVIDLAAQPEVVVQHLTVGDAPEGLAISPDGQFAAVSVLQGSYDAPKGASYAHPSGKIELIDLRGKTASVLSTALVGAFPEGVGFSADSRHVYAGNFADSSLSVLTIDNNGSMYGRKDISLPGPPGSLRVLGQ